MSNTNLELQERIEHALKGDERDLPEVRRLVEAELRADPDNYEWLDLEVRVLVPLSQGDLALRLLEEYIRVYPSNDRASARLAWVQWQVGHREEAMAEIRAVLARNPQDHHARSQMLEWLLDTKEWKRVQEIAEEGLAFDPDSRDFLMAGARSAANMKLETVAKEAFSRLLELDPQSEEVARSYAEFLLDMNHSSQAAALLDRFVTGEVSDSKTLLRAADANFRLGNVQQALALCRRVTTNPNADNDDIQHELLDTMHRNIGLTGTDEFGMELIKSQEAIDSFAVEFLERVGQRGNRGSVMNVFQAVSGNPIRYCRTMARFLSTFYSQPVVPGTTARWVAANRHHIESNAMLWGGVGAWHVARGKWQDAVAHLSHYEGRPGLKPWMLYLLGQAYENLNDYNEADRVYRRALEFPPDHSEPGIRSRLGFNLAMEGMASAGRLIVTGCSEPGKRMTTPEDLIRIVAVEALSTAARAKSPMDRRAILEQAHTEMRNVAREAPLANSKLILIRFRNATIDMLSRDLESG